MKIGVVVVTFNRLPELKKTVQLYEQQTIPPEYILVVDNHSTDGTDEFLWEWKAKTDAEIPHLVVTLEENAGGSGGFHAGTEAAVDLNAEWIWLADDDAYPEKDAFEKLDMFAKKHPEVMHDTVALCTKNYGDKGIVLGHRCRIRKTLIGTLEIPVDKSEYEKEYFTLDMYSFVGAVVRKEVLKKVGPPRKDFFIYADDTEHALRMRKYGSIVCVPAAGVFHRDNNSYSREASWRDYYATRNTLLVNREHYGIWAYQTRKIRRILTALRSRNTEKIKVFMAAVSDAQHNRTGQHPVYRPGWTPKKKYPKA